MLSMKKTEKAPMDAEFSRWMDLRQRTCTKNHNFRQRNVNGTFEIVNYTGDDSFATLWLNCEPAGYPLHWHSTAEIIMPIYEPYCVTTNRTTYELKERDILIIPPGELHRLSPAPKGMRMILLFNLSVLNKYHGFTRLFALLSNACLISPETMPEIHKKATELLYQVIDEYATDDPLNEPALLSYLIQFFVLLSRNNKELPASTPASQGNKQHEYVEKFNVVFDFIEHNFTEDISLEDVAARIGFSKFHFSRLFHQFTGTSFYDYLSLRRLKAAEVLLLNPTLPITEIALQSGFSSISTFNRVFKKYKECTPTEFKEFRAGSGSIKKIHSDKSEI